LCKLKWVKIAKHLWWADRMAYDLFEPLSWSCGPGIEPREFVAVLIKRPRSQSIAVYRWNGSRLMLRCTWTIDEFLERTRSVPPPWFTEVIA
jgi:hypothetical protein